MSGAFDEYADQFSSKFDNIEKIIRSAQSATPDAPGLVKILAAMNLIKELMEEARNAADELMEVVPKAAIEDMRRFGAPTAEALEMLESLGIDAGEVTEEKPDPVPTAVRKGIESPGYHF